MLLNEPLNDYDIYLMDRDVLMDLTKYYTNGLCIIFDGLNKESLIKEYNSQYFSEYGIQGIDRNNSHAISLRNLKEDQIKLYFENANGGMKVNESVPVEERNYIPMYFSPNAISLSNDIQIVIRFHGTAEQIHKTFDFIHATNYFTFKDGLVTNVKALESIITKQLQYQGSLYPVTSIIRAKKFIKRGFNINAGEYLKIMFQISALDLTNVDVLEEQLIGVDVAYFDLIITALRNKYDSDKDFTLTTEYFNSLIDRIFNDTEDSE